jgi:hypothetical protein
MAAENMDKKQFVESAPLYYAAAIYRAMREESHSSSQSIKDAYRVTDEDDPEGYTLLYVRVLFGAAIDWLKSRDMISIVTDDFGPDIYTVSQTGEAHFNYLSRDPKSPFGKMQLVAASAKGWLDPALRQVNIKFDELKVQAADFENPDAEWRPLPLEKSDAQREQVIEALDNVVQNIEQTNEYAEKLPEEKAHVIAGLTTLATTLRTATSTSLPFIKTYGLDPLAKLLKRFAGAALETTISVARLALTEWLKKKFGIDV